MRRAPRSRALIASRSGCTSTFVAPHGRLGHRERPAPALPRPPVRRRAGGPLSRQGHRPPVRRRGRRRRASPRLGGLFVGLRFAGRIRGIVEKAEALSPVVGDGVTPQRLRRATSWARSTPPSAASPCPWTASCATATSSRGSPRGCCSSGPRGASCPSTPPRRRCSACRWSATAARRCLSSGRSVPARPAATRRWPRCSSDGGQRGAAGQVSEVSVVTAGGRQLLARDHRRSAASGARIASRSLLLLRDASEKQRIREEIRRARPARVPGRDGGAGRPRDPDAAGDHPRAPRAPRGRPRRGRFAPRLHRARPPGPGPTGPARREPLTLSHPEPKAWQPVSVADLLAERARRCSRRDSADRGGVGLRACRPSWGDPFRLGEVFTNLIQNALQASPSTGSGRGDERRPSAATRAVRRAQHRGGHPRRAPRAHLPAVLHDEGARDRTRPAPSRGRSSRPIGGPSGSTATAPLRRPSSSSCPRRGGRTGWLMTQEPATGRTHPDRGGRRRSRLRPPRGPHPPGLRRRGGAHRRPPCSSGCMGGCGTSSCST